MKQLIISLLCLTSTAFSLAQQNDKVSRSILLYSNFLAENKSYEINRFDGALYEINRLASLGKLSFGVRTQQLNGWSREWEINNINLWSVNDRTEIQVLEESGIEQIVEGQRETTTSVGFRLEWQKLFYTSKSEKLKLFAGVGIGTGWYHLTIKPKISTRFSSSVSDVELNSQIIPRLTYEISDKVKLDLNVLGYWLNSSMVTIVSDNPRIPRRNRRNTTGNVDFPTPRIHARIGLAVDIWQVD